MTTVTQERTVKIAEIYVTQRAKRARNTITKLYQASGDTEWQALNNLYKQYSALANSGNFTLFSPQYETCALYDGRQLGDILLTPLYPDLLDSYERINFYTAYDKYHPET